MFFIGLFSRNFNICSKNHPFVLSFLMAIKEKSTNDVIINKLLLKDIAMNLHEECLLKYLINPLDLFYSTELLKMNNDLIEKNINKTISFNNANKISYTASRI